MRPERTHKYLVMATAAIGIVVVAFSVAKLVRDPSKGDFGAYLHAARQLTLGENLYLTPASESGLFYIYPPFFAFLMAPFTMVPTNVAVVVWGVLNAFLTLWVTRTVFELISEKRFSDQPALTQWVMTFFPLLFTSRFLIQHLDLGQANILEMALVVLTLKLAVARNRPHLAGLVFGFALAIKSLVIQFTLLWLLARKVRVLAWIAVGGMAALLLPALFLGFSDNLAQLRYWVESFVLDTAQRETRLTLGYNYSPKALLYRLFTPINAFTVQGKEYPLTLFQLSNGMIHAIDWAIRIALLGGISAVWLRHRRSTDKFVMFCAWAMTFALTPLLFPTAQKNYFVFLLPAYVYAFYAWYCLKHRDVWLAGFTIGSFFMTTLTNRTFVGSFAAAAFLAAGSFIWGALLAALAVARAAEVHSSSAHSVVSTTWEGTDSLRAR